MSEETENPQTVEELQAKVATLQAKLEAVQPAKPEIADEPAKPGEMKTATITLGLNKFQTIVRTGITPAEMQVLIVMHMPNYQADPIVAFTETATVKRSSNQELSRLRQAYGRDRVRALYGPNSSLPTTFALSHESGVAWAVENPPEESQPLVGRRPTAEEAAAVL